jgi:excisionase family DNA binding protein
VARPQPSGLTVRDHTDVRGLARACARGTCPHRGRPRGRTPSVISEGRTPLPQTPETGQLLYTLAEAAEALRISRTKLYELLDSGEIESVHIGRSRKIPADALRTFIDRLRIPHQRKENA